MPSPDACSNALPSTGTTLAIHVPPPPPPRQTPLHEPVHSLHRESAFSPTQQFAGWVSPHLWPFTQPFSSQLLLTRPTLPHLACPTTFFHTKSCMQEKEHTSSYNTIILFCLYPTLLAVFNAKLSAVWKARQNRSCSNSHLRQSFLFHSSSLFVFVIEGSTWSWIVLGFHGRRMRLVHRERLFVAFNWRQPSFLLLLFTANGHQNCWKSSFFMYFFFCKRDSISLWRGCVEIFHLKSRFYWELSATHVHIQLQSDNRSSTRKEQTPFLSQINSAALSGLVTSQNLCHCFSSPSAHSCLHMTNTATWETHLTHGLCSA